MGEIAGRFSEFAVITSDNPRTEDPMAIIESVEEGVKRSGTKYTVIEKRKEAIRYALSSAHQDDVRITSYNVCYTKLLRPGACGRRRDLP